MHLSSITRPNDDIQRIVKLIIQNEQTLPFLLKAGSVFDMSMSSKPSVFLIEEGQVALYRKLDNKLILHFQPPFPFGITLSSSHTENYYMVCEEDTRASILNKEHFFSNISGNQYWMSILNIVTYLIEVAEEQHQKYTLVTSNYDIIKSCIKEIWTLSDEQRNKISIYDYILSRHQISRSSITKILKSLNEGCYIITKRAVLKNVYFLPEKY
ncbi:cyclic nucleotide-binding protein [Buttiauxella gaviniae ATCC 51604]|uniref:Cyclic nucleotide-binding protein n=1 Tax=Buttiauxella gaviniae ATCC 51604 TaxID=1354253 RepID=A0A1B7HLG1_9ENTR|nr:helix-turn-helix domain-containing protein [Buttiauxella gaviniae]OAT16449.1 cyclic nucleotide-binding protein [Buttiauxella gaviniae ATCC 51604]